MFPFFSLKVGLPVNLSYHDRFFVVTDSLVSATQLEKVNDQVSLAFERDDTFYSRVEKVTDMEVSGRDARLPLEIRPGGKFGHYDPEGGSLGLGGGITTDKAVIGCVHVKFAVQLNRKPVMNTDSKRKSVLDAFKHNMAKAMPEFRAQCDRLCMTGGNGVLATIASITNDGGGAGIDVYTLSSTDGFGARLLRFAQDITVYDTTLATHRTSGGERTVLAIDYAAKTINVADVPGAVATDKILLSGLSGASPVSLFGVPYHHNAASTGTWLGFNRANFPEIRANQVNAGGSSFALPYARLSMNKIGDRIGENNNVNPQAWMHPCQAQSVEELAQLIQSIDRAGGGDQKVNLYFKTGSGQFQLAGAQAMLSFNWNKTRIDFIDTKFWKRPVIKEPGMYESGGRKIFEIRASNGAVVASDIFYLTASWNLAHLNPAVGSYIDNLAIPSGY